MHARVLKFEGRGPGWCGSPGRVIRTDRRNKEGSVLFECGRSLDEEHAKQPWCWATIKSPRSRERKFVTCPECLTALSLRFGEQGKARSA